MKAGAKIVSPKSGKEGSMSLPKNAAARSGLFLTRTSSSKLSTRSSPALMRVPSRLHQPLFAEKLFMADPRSPSGCNLQNCPITIFFWFSTTSENFGRNAESLRAVRVQAVEASRSSLRTDVAQQLGVWSRFQAASHAGLPKCNEFWETFLLDFTTRHPAPHPPRSHR